jgi:hypothetical protein
MFLKYLYVVLIPPSPPLLIKVRFDLKDIFNITINIKKCNMIVLFYFIMGLYLSGGFCPKRGGLCPGGFCPVPAIAI